MSGETFSSLTDPKVQACPYAAYAQLRDSAPVYREPETGFWVLTRYDDVKAVAADWEHFSNETGQLRAGRAGSPGRDQVLKLFDEEGFRPIEALVSIDPPVHRYHRAAVNTAFSAPRVRAMQTYITQVVDELIDRIAAQGRVDFVAKFAIGLPMLVIADQLGVPRDMMRTFKRWSDSALISANIGNPPEVQIEAACGIVEMQNFFSAQFDKLLAEPRDCILNDIAHGTTEDGTLLSLKERITVAGQVLVAGNETTTSTLSSALYRMIKTPGMEERLRNDPALIPAYVEECLRLDSPLQAQFRKATADVQIGDQVIPKGDIVVLRWGAGNRDERSFGCPEQIDLERQNSRSHLAFGHGIHFCPGRELARNEIRIAFERLLARLKNFRLAAAEDESATLQPAYHAYGLRKLDVTFEEICSSGQKD